MKEPGINFGKNVNFFRAQDSYGALSFFFNPFSVWDMLYNIIVFQRSKKTAKKNFNDFEIAWNPKILCLSGRKSEGFSSKTEDFSTVNINWRGKWSGNVDCHYDLEPRYFRDKSVRPSKLPERWPTPIFFSPFFPRGACCSVRESRTTAAAAAAGTAIGFSTRACGVRSFQCCARSRLVRSRVSSRPYPGREYSGPKSRVFVCRLSLYKKNNV